jgi:uncharacterized protein (DUF849 family)
MKRTIRKEKIEKNEQLYFYSQVHTENKTSQWWFLAKEYPKYLPEITNVIRLLCGSYKIRGKRISNPVVYTDVCDICQKNFVNPVNLRCCIVWKPHVVLEKNQQLNELFVKTSESTMAGNSNSFVAVTEVEQVELLSCLEKLESKFTAFTAECSASMSVMKSEIEELRNSLKLRDTKIELLEAEIASLKTCCKVNNERATENVKELGFELGLAKGKIQNVEQRLVKLTKTFDQSINKENVHKGHTKKDN